MSPGSFAVVQAGPPGPGGSLLQLGFEQGITTTDHEPLDFCKPMLKTNLANTSRDHETPWNSSFVRIGAPKHACAYEHGHGSEITRVPGRARPKTFPHSASHRANGKDIAPPRPKCNDPLLETPLHFIC